MTGGTFIEVSEKGQWVKVPAVRIGPDVVTIRGKGLRIAAVHDEWWQEREVEDPEAFVKQLKQRRGDVPRADLFVFMQQVPGSQPKHKYAMEMESVAAARTASFKEWWESLPQESRKNTRRAEKRGVVISVRPLDDELIRGIMDVNNDSPVRQGGRNLHYGKSFEETKKDSSSFADRCDFICAHCGDELIGFLKLVYKGEVAALLNLTTKAGHNDKRPANALMTKAVELCAAKGASYLTYGLFNYGNKRSSPLRDFKVRNGFTEMLTPKFYVPLTAKGALAMRLGLHRGLLGVFPESVIALAVRARGKWYDLKRTK